MKLGPRLAQDGRTLCWDLQQPDGSYKVAVLCNHSVIRYIQEGGVIPEEAMDTTKLNKESFGEAIEYLKTAAVK